MVNFFTNIPVNSLEMVIEVFPFSVVAILNPSWSTVERKRAAKDESSGSAS